MTIKSREENNPLNVKNRNLLYNTGDKLMFYSF
jgi:hypothetical protein